MEHLLTNQTASLTELRDTKSLLKACGNKPVAILNRNQLEGYFVPVASVSNVQHECTAEGEAMSLFKARQSKLQSTIDYLKDK